MAGRKRVCLAVDLGAESGRVVAGLFNGSRLELQEIHRFSNRPVRLPGGLHWDVLRLFSDIQAGLARSASLFGKDLASAGVDTWGVDFGLLDANGALLGNPFHYRDARTEGVPERVFKTVSRETLYRATGIQFMQLNTMFQLAALAEARTPPWPVAKTLLFMPDLFRYWLTGHKGIEWTTASTSQCFNTRNRTLTRSILKKLDIPPSLFAPMVEPGTLVGTLLPAIESETGARKLKIVAPGSHDTASAVAAVPLARPNDAFISSGTWSILGMETDRPLITQASYEQNFTNEGGVCGRNRLMKNLVGLWLVQECRRTWEEEGTTLSYAELAAQAGKAPPLRAWIQPDDPVFFSPGRMPDRIVQACRRSGQPVPRTRGEIIRVILESLALAYGRTLRQLEAVSGQSPSVLHIVGGGCQNTLLNQWTSNATGLPVRAGPVEATAAGNLLIQLLALKEIRSLDEGRELIRASFPARTVEPRQTRAWREAAERFRSLDFK
jgi:sugar (pentulose or hexulose) kinase